MFIPFSVLNAISVIVCTHRNNRINIPEHRGFSFRTGGSLTNPSSSIIRNHSGENYHTIEKENFKILYRSNHTNLRIAGSLYL